MQMGRGSAVRGWLHAAMILAAVVAPAGGVARAQSLESAPNLSGSWQGTLEVGNGLRIVLKVTGVGDAAHAGWKGVLFSLDDPARAYEGRNTTQMSFDGSMVRFAIAPMDLSYEGKLSADRKSMAGTATHGGQSHPLILVRAEGDAAWTIPGEDRPMAANADPDWEVATVRPTNPNATASAGYHLSGRQYSIMRQSVESLLMVGYGVHKKQILNAPGWIESEQWDMNGVMDTPGRPSEDQARSLVRKLLAERFGLVTHTEQRELSVYTVTVAKGGMKMTPSAGDPNGLPDENDSENGGQATMHMENSPISALATLLRFRLDRPVVDETGLTGRYDFLLKWTVDETRAPTDGSAAPGIFTAMQEQLGLKLEPVKTMADVLVVDTVQRPSAN